MNAERLFTLKNRWYTISLGLTAGFAAAAAVGGLVLLPYAQHGLKLNGIWDAICSAAGVPTTPVIAMPFADDVKTSTVVMTSAMMVHPTAVSIGHGATLALQCAICHVSDTVKTSDFPALTGQYFGVIYKELHDFQSGARVNAVMAPFAAALSDEDIIDVAAYYAYLPRRPAYRPGAEPSRPAIVSVGAPMRNVPPCGACHGDTDNKAGTPRLEGQSAGYLKAQLQAFAGSTRHNDISAQMRNVARRMTPAEVDAAATYYASRP